MQEIKERDGLTTIQLRKNSSGNLLISIASNEEYGDFASIVLGVPDVLELRDCLDVFLWSVGNG